MSFSLKTFFLPLWKSGKPQAPAAAATDGQEPGGPVNTKPELNSKELAVRNWIGVDLDGTLAYFEGWNGFDDIGDPIPGMKARVLDWIAQGYQVKIFTARASAPEGIEPVKRWLEKNGFPPLEITASKDFGMIELWDDRAIQVVANTGSPVISPKWAAKPRAPFFGLPQQPQQPGHTPTVG